MCVYIEVYSKERVEFTYRKWTRYHGKVETTKVLNRVDAESAFHSVKNNVKLQADYIRDLVSTIDILDDASFKRIQEEEQVVLEIGFKYLHTKIIYSNKGSKTIIEFYTTDTALFRDRGRINQNIFYIAADYDVIEELLGKDFLSIVE